MPVSCDILKYLPWLYKFFYYSFYSLCTCTCDFRFCWIYKHEWTIIPLTCNLYHNCRMQWKRTWWPTPCAHGETSSCRLGCKFNILYAKLNAHVMDSSRKQWITCLTKCFVTWSMAKRMSNLSLPCNLDKQCSTDFFFLPTVLPIPCLNFKVIVSDLLVPCPLGTCRCAGRHLLAFQENLLALDDWTLFFVWALR